MLKQVAERQPSLNNKIQLIRFMPAGQYSVREAFEGSTVLITGATGTVQLLSLMLCNGQGVVHRESHRCMHSGYIGGLVLEQLLRVGKIGKVRPVQSCTLLACMRKVVP